MVGIYGALRSENMFFLLPVSSSPGKKCGCRSERRVCVSVCVCAHTHVFLGLFLSPC